MRITSRRGRLLSVTVSMDKLPLFRAWHKTRHRMYLVKTIRYPRESETWKAPEKIWLFDDEMKGYRLRDLVMMRGSPFHDKHGRPLFEKDIIRYRVHLLFLSYEEGWGGWSLEDAINGDPNLSSVMTDDEQSSVEYVGNTFEHPHLVK